jgi:hypothetical protein
VQVRTGGSAHLFVPPTAAMLFTSGLSKVVEEYGPATGATRTAEETKKLADKKQKPRLVRRHTDMNLGKKQQVVLADLNKEKIRSLSTGRGKHSVCSRLPPTVDSGVVRAESSGINLPSFLRSKHNSLYRQRTADKLTDVPEGQVVGARATSRSFFPIYVTLFLSLLPCFCF